MNESVDNLLKYYFFLIHIWIIFYSSIFYSFEKNNEKLFLSTNCQINQTWIEEIPCLENKFCRINHYGIIYGKNYFGYFKILPTWFSPIDKQNLLETPMIFAGKPLSKPLNLSCYYDRLNHQYIRWSKPNPQGFIYLILISSIVVCLTIIHCFNGYYCQRR
jgi:hypothetical protein